MPFDETPPSITSGIGLGSSAATTRGLKQNDFQILGNLISDVICGFKNNISNNKIQPVNVTSATFENGSVWSLAWFIWTGTGKVTGTEVQINVHHAFRFKDEKIVDAYHFFDPTLLNNEMLASSK